MNLIFKNAIVRTPCPRLIEGITTAKLGAVNYELALEQHAAYVKALKSLKVQVSELPLNNNFPDSTFVEDVALCTPHCAIITNPGAESRKGESAFISEALRQHYDQIETIQTPGTVEAGDIMMVGKHYFIGISARTNTAGAAQMIIHLDKYGLTGSMIPLEEVLHLKTGISYLEDNNLLVSGEFINKPEFHTFNKIEVDQDELYAANSLWINGTVLIPANHPKTKAKIAALGYDCVELEMSEFQKVDGGLSCLSLRF